jgi:FkbM family methyltransferase
MLAAEIWESLRHPARRLFPKTFYSMGSTALNWTSCLVKVGFKSTLQLRDALRGVPGTRHIQLNIPQLLHPFYVRPGTSDAGGIVQNVLREEWGAFFPPGPIRCIVDAGANCGDTTAWYLSKFPQATVVALEPDPDNYAMLCKNCEPYGPRAVLLNLALWSSDAKLTVQTKEKTDSFWVDEADGDAASVCEGISMPQLLQLIRFETIDILKLDIEGAELQLFSSHPEEWLPSVRCVAMEIHGPKIREAVYSTMMRCRFESKTFRGVHVFRRTE